MSSHAYSGGTALPTSLRIIKLLIQAEQKLIDRCDELVVLVDSSKFEARSSLVLCPLKRIDIVITDDGISDQAAAMLERSEIKLIVVPVGRGELREGAAS